AERTDPFLWSLVEIPAGTNYVLHAETEDQPPREALLVREGPLYRTDRYALRIDPEAGGIIRWTDLEQKRDLTDLYREDAILRPVYERTDAPQNGLEQCSLRRSFCRSRRNAETKQYPARLQQVSILRNSPERAVLRLEYEAEGCKLLFEDLTFYRGMSRVDVNLILLKKSEWDPESLYLSLPFTAKTGTVFVDKTDSIIRPGIDQLPRACSNFFLTQNGMVFTDGEGRFTSVYCADTPLIWMGRLDHLQPDEANGTAEQNRRPAYAWIMNNVWETNFKVMLAGFYEFSFTVRTGEGEADMAFAQMREESCLPLPYLHTDLAN
ncbi:MAG: hypothetical protein IJR83_05590, partial [Clostridia bacterium]|nr:hypothetical protein [Clostridia bacterium]